jgi:hypothetical protein
MEGGQIRALINWEEARVLLDFEPPNPSVIVKGQLRCPMDVRLEPRLEVAAEPEYWPIEVVGYHDEVVDELITRYEEQFSLADLQKGTKGIELIGQRSDPGHRCLASEMRLIDTGSQAVDSGYINRR